MGNSVDFAPACDLFHKYNLKLTYEQYNYLAKYARMIIEECQFQNITAVHTEEEIWIRHFLDSAYICSYLPKTPFQLIDIGTGGGIPGIPISILMPHASVTLLDSEMRKISFCQSVSDALFLNLNCISGRAEEIAKLSAHREQFDFAISRAMTVGTILCELSLPFLKNNGVLLAMKGRNYDASVERFEQAAAVLNSKMDEPIRYELEGEQKTLICVHKVGEIPAQYPRRFAKIKRQPL